MGKVVTTFVHVFKFLKGTPFTTGTSFHNFIIEINRMNVSIVSEDDVIDGIF